MKIISKGKFSSDGSITFTCPRCGCMFSMASDEYYVDNVPWATNISFITYKYYHANCPECHKMCRESKDDDMCTYTTPLNGTAAKPITTDHIEITCDGGETKCENG